MQNNFSRGLAL